MVFQIDVSHIIGIVIAAALVQGAIQLVGFLIFRAQASTWHVANQERFAKIEKALGLEDPDDTAFLRASEAKERFKDIEGDQKEIHGKLRNHDGRIGVLERRR